MKKRIKFLFLLGIMAAGVLTGCGKAEARKDFHTEMFGENVYVFSPEDDPAKIQSVIDTLYAKQETNQFGTERYALYFLPGEYDKSLMVDVGYYTQVAGLGALPTDTTLPKLQCLARWLGDDSNHNACCNFWRGVENIQLDSNTVWAVSQATDMRRVQVNGALYLHDDYGWCSGGFLADSVATRMVDSGSQQQWLSRNNEYGVWMGENWNMVFVGDTNAPTKTWPVASYTAVEKTPVVREKPFLTYDEKAGYRVFVPALRRDTVGISWKEGQEGEYLPMKDFYIAKPGTSTAKEVNEALESGKHLLLTPGIYEWEDTIRVTKENTLVLGMGLATIVSSEGRACMEVADEDGIMIAGVLFDAGTTESTNLLTIGAEADKKEHETNPICLSDVYFRVGGTMTATPTTTECCVTIHSNDVVTDNLWVWRADHGDQVAWDKNVAKNGVIVNGDNVTAYALMVEHFEEYQTIWNGNGGRVYMYQSEIPYDVPSQEVWMSHEGTKNGYSSFKVADEVTDFEATGLGIYLYNRDAKVLLTSPMELPDAEGVKVKHIITVLLTGHPAMEYIINDSGNGVYAPGQVEYLLDYCNGEFK